MKLKLTFLLIFSAIFMNAQIWASSLADAKKLARETNKLMVIDFTATWCKPCKVMESEFWYNKKYQKTLSKFILVSVDIDTDKGTAMSYGVNSIPNVKVADHKGVVYHEFLGFDGAKSADQELSGFPDSVGDLYDNLDFKNAKMPTDEELVLLASSYQSLVQKSGNRSAKNDFVGLSNSYFSKCIKNCKNADFVEKSFLSKSFNNVLTNSSKKTIKEIDIAKISQENKPYALYILANAHFEEKNTAEADKMLNAIADTGNKDWIAYGNALKQKYAEK